MRLATIHKAGLYVMVTLVGMMTAAFAAYYLLVSFVYPLKSPDIISAESFQGITQARGAIVAIERDSQSVSTTTVVTLVTDAGESKRVRVPLNAGLDCFATNIVDPAGLVVGDVIDVKGAAASDGEIFPCQEPEHHVVRVVATLPTAPAVEYVSSSTDTTTSESTDIEVAP